MKNVQNDKTGLNIASNHFASKHSSLKSSYDYIIVGAGSAGCVIARRLVESSDATVLLLEAGGSDAGIQSIINPLQWPGNIGSPVDYLYANAPSPLINNRSFPIPRGKVLGGSGSINAIVWARGSKADYDGWAAAGNQGWDYQSVLPLFKKIEDWEGGATDFHGAGGPLRIENATSLHPSALAFMEASISYGMPSLNDTNGPSPEGAGPMSMNIRNGKRDSTAEGYLKPVLNKKNLTLVTGAKVLKLNFMDTTCIGLDFVQSDAKYTVAACREVILCAGALDTPRILMLSGIGEEQELKQLGIDTLVNLPGVGKNMQDHPMVHGLCYEAREPMGELNYNLIGSTAYWKSHSGLAEPDLMFVPFQVPLLTKEIGAQFPPAANSFCILPTLIKPKSRGYVKMKTALHDGPLEIQANYLSHPDDLSALIHAVEIGMDLAEEPAMKKLVKQWIAPKYKIGRKQIEAFVRDGLSSYYHQVGTCSMGSGDEAVVNNKLCVHGTLGLRIADASIMPKITSGNPNSPVIMIGEFAAKTILATNG